jgi:hypothetical protein
VLKTEFVFHILGMSSSQLTNSIIFQRGRLKPPTRWTFHQNIGDSRRKDWDSTLGIDPWNPLSHLVHLTLWVSENWVYDPVMMIWFVNICYFTSGFLGCSILRQIQILGYAQWVLYLIQFLNWADRPLTSLAQTTYFNPTVVKHHSYPAVIQPGNRTFEALRWFPSPKWQNFQVVVTTRPGFCWYCTLVLWVKQ